MNKVLASVDEAIRDITDGCTLMVGGFGLCGVPETLIEGLVRKGVKNLTTVSNNAGVDDFGLGRLLYAGQIKKHIGSYVGENKLFEQMVLTGSVELELVPQGTLAERIRAGGAGIPAFFTPTGYGTQLTEGKDVREFGGRPCVLEHAIHADVALIGASSGDRWGNLTYRKTARNYGPIMATAAALTIAQIRHTIQLGALDPESIVTPGIFVDRVVQV